MTTRRVSMLMMSVLLLVFAAVALAGNGAHLDQVRFPEMVLPVPSPSGHTTMRINAQSFSGLDEPIKSILAVYGRKAKLDKAELIDICKKLGLFNPPRENPFLVFQMGDVAYFADSKLPGLMIIAELAAKAAVLQQADRDRMQLPPTMGDLSAISKPYAVRLYSSFRKSLERRI